MTLAIDKEQIKWIEDLINNTQNAGEMKPELTLMLIVQRVQEEYNCEKDDAIQMCFQVMQNMTIK